MRAFIDTSSLFKKYVDEKGAAEFDTLLASITEVVVSPITVVEFHSILNRRLREKTLLAVDAHLIEKEFLKDYSFFGIVQWNDDLVKETLRVSQKYPLRTLDAIQLSSAVVAGGELFVTSDKRLFEVAEKEFDDVRLVG